MRLIDADEFEKYVRKHCKDSLADLWCELIRRQPTCDVTKTQQWIPVTERLPEDCKDVIVWYEYFRYGNYNRMYQTYGIGYQHEGHWGGCVSGICARCIAWMPLPEKYKEETKTVERPKVERIIIDDVSGKRAVEIVKAGEAG